MNTQLAFAFGVLAMIAITMLVVFVVGIVKVIRHDKEFRNLREEIGHIHRHFTEVERGFYLELDQTRKNIHEEINDLRKTFHQEMDDTKRNIDRHVEELKREAQAYTDSRVDKLEQKLTPTSKTILND
jgi:F0F1-type ATP synthase membrane subunit b/b'